MSGAPAPDPDGPPFLPRIESLRGYAALCVAFFHCDIALAFSRKPPETPWDRFAWRYVIDPFGWVMNGSAGVIVFFVISGLVLSLVLDRKPAHRSVSAFAGFMGRRLLRIYPAHLVALLLFVPLAYFTLFRIPVADPARLEASGALLVPWVGDFVYGHLLPGQWLRTAVLYNNYYNPVTWTLQVELIGSLFVPFFAAWSRSGSLRRDAAALAILAAAALLVDAEKRPDLFPLYLPAFYLGCMVRTRGSRLAEMVGSTPCRLYGALAALLALLLVPHAVVRTGLATIPVHFAVGLMTLGGFGLVSLVASATGQGRAGAAMLHPVSRRMGRLSYSFYLWHDLVLFAFVRLLFIAVAPDDLAAWPLTVFVSTMAATVLLAVAVAAISYALVEKPFIALGRKLDRRLASATAGKAAGGPAPV